MTEPRCLSACLATGVSRGLRRVRGNRVNEDQGRRQRRARVAVIDPDPSRGVGLSTSLKDAGFEVAEPSDVVAWSRCAGARCVMIDEHTPSAPKLQSELANVGGATVVLMLDELTSSRVTRAIADGVHGVVARRWEPQRIVSVVQSSMDGRTELPTPLLRQLIVEVPVTISRPAAMLDEEAVTFLRYASSGLPMTAIAHRMSCSERTLYRKQRRLLRRLGVVTRAQAIALAINWGLHKEA